jgi:hypothetical protein
MSVFLCGVCVRHLALPPPRTIIDWGFMSTADDPQKRPPSPRMEGARGFTLQFYPILFQIVRFALTVLKSVPDVIWLRIEG